MKINPDKCHLLINGNGYRPVNIGNYVIKNSQNEKLLGVLIELNCFCGMIDRQNAFSLICSRDHCQKSSPSRISDTPRVGFEPEQIWVQAQLSLVMQKWKPLHHGVRDVICLDDGRCNLRHWKQFQNASSKCYVKYYRKNFFLGT